VVIRAVGRDDVHGPLLADETRREQDLEGDAPRLEDRERSQVGHRRSAP